VRTLDILKVVEVLDAGVAKIRTFPELMSASKDAKDSEVIIVPNSLT